MITFASLANEYRTAVEQKDSSKMYDCTWSAIRYLSKVIDQTGNDSLSFDETQENTLLQFMSLKGINENTEPELFDLVNLLNIFRQEDFNISLFSHFLNEIRASIRSSAAAGEFGNMTTNDDRYVIELINSFYSTFKMPSDTKLETIWTPDYSFLRTQQQDLSMPSILGKNHDQRSLAFKPSAMLFMSASFWRNDYNVHYFSNEQKKIFKVRTTNQPFVLKRSFDEKCLPKSSFLYALSMHGGLIAAQSSEIENITSRTATVLNHSTFRAGQNLFAAGELTVDEFGMITEINGDSGHYLTPDENIIEAAFYLLDKGFIAETCRVKFRSTTLSESISLKELLTNDSLHFSSESVQRIIDEKKENKSHGNKRLKALV